MKIKLIHCMEEYTVDNTVEDYMARIPFILPHSYHTVIVLLVKVLCNPNDIVKKKSHVSNVVVKNVQIKVIIISIQVFNGIDF